MRISSSHRHGDKIALMPEIPLDQKLINAIENVAALGPIIRELTAAVKELSEAVRKSAAMPPNLK